jgi:hypothetical protein
MLQLLSLQLLRRHRRQPHRQHDFRTSRALRVAAVETRCRPALRAGVYIRPGECSLRRCAFADSVHQEEGGDYDVFGSAVNILVAIQISFAVIAASLPDLRTLVARKGRVRRGSFAVCSGGVFDEEKVQMGPVRFEGKKVLRKPDWIRSRIPPSLMETVGTRHDVECLGWGHEEVAVPKRAAG